MEILQRLDEVPTQWRERLRNNGGGYVNHIFYWETMCPHSQQLREGEGPTGLLAQDINATFGGFESFRSEFSAAAARLFGSGYVWLCEDATGHLSIRSTQNQVRGLIASRDLLSPMALSKAMPRACDMLALSLDTTPHFPWGTFYILSIRILH